eukprot:221296-Pelagomonas_calceolata.AAC.6
MNTNHDFFMTPEDAVLEVGVPWFTFIMPDNAVIALCFYGAITYMEDLWSAMASVNKACRQHSSSPILGIHPEISTHPDTLSCDSALTFPFLMHCSNLQGIIDGVLRGKGDNTVPPSMVRTLKQSGLVDDLTPGFLQVE